MILVTGAAGKTGRAVVAALARRQTAVRAWVRRPSDIAGASETFVGDMTDEAAWADALAGVRRVYHICPNMQPNEVEIGRFLINAAQKTAVQHLVYHSVLHPQTEKMPHHWHKLRVEEMLFESGIPNTILQPTAYMQNIFGGWAQIVGAGIYTTPYPILTRLSLVDLADVAEVAAKVLTEAGHEGATYELVGTEGLTQTAVSEILSQQLGRPVVAQAISLDEWEAGAAGLPPFARATLRHMFRYYADFGLIGNPNVLTFLLGRQPTTLAEVVARHYRMNSVASGVKHDESC